MLDFRLVGMSVGRDTGLFFPAGNVYAGSYHKNSAPFRADLLVKLVSIGQWCSFEASVLIPPVSPASPVAVEGGGVVLLAGAAAAGWRPVICGEALLGRRHGNHPQVKRGKAPPTESNVRRYVLTNFVGLV